MEKSSIPLVYIFLLPFLFSQSVAGESGSISILITEKGLDFVRELAVEQAVGSLVPLHLRDLEKTLSVPFIGKVYAKLSNITLHQINVSSSLIKPGSSGITIVASDAKAKASMDWFYSYSSWFVPFDFSDRGTASIQVDGLEVGLTASMENKGGTMYLSVIESGCSVENISIVLEGGASWLYQGVLDAFEEQIRASLETTIKKKLTDGILKVDSLMENLPKQVKVDEFVSLNVTFVNQPVLESSSIALDIDGLFSGNYNSHKFVGSSAIQKNSLDTVLCHDRSPMLGISLDEDVFSSASLSYFQGGQLHWMVDKLSDQALLNTAGWRFIIPQLYKKYPNEDMKLNITLTSPPSLKISRRGFESKILSDMIVDVMDVKGDTSVACISMVVSASGVAEILGNKIGGRIVMDDFTLSLKWSKIGNFHMSLIQGVIRVFLNNVVVPVVNSRLRTGFPLPMIRGFTLENASISSLDSRIDVCSDLVFISRLQGNLHPLNFL